MRQVIAITASAVAASVALLGIGAGVSQAATVPKGTPSKAVVVERNNTNNNIGFCCERGILEGEIPALRTRVAGCFAGWTARGPFIASLPVLWRWCRDAHRIVRRQFCGRSGHGKSPIDICGGVRE